MYCNEECIKYYIPPVAQQNEEELLAVFSFKYATANAGLGWIGKKVTESRCGSCSRCVDICPHKALKGLNWDIKALRNDLIDYHLCNQKRSTYIEKYGRKNACGLCMVVCPFGMWQTI